MFSLKNKVAVVTGGGSGIGEAAVRALAASGARVVLFDRDPAGAQRVTNDVPGATFIQCDVTDGDSVAQAAKQTLALTDGTIDILVNNAGIGHVGTALTTTPADLDRMYSVNVRGVLMVTQAFLPTLLAQKRGSVINMGSVGGIVGIRDRLAYCATKFAVVGMTKCMALDHATSGVRFNAVCPGRVETPFVTARLSEYADPVIARKEMSESQAVGRMGKPGEIAAAIVYLASDESSFVTGSDFIIDGGFSAGK